jgi:D-alanyl-D-alanine carboxypeptidase/D-alanyl-D-alanine-endopeptidase (penicillin-binding protein 4)
MRRGSRVPPTLIRGAGFLLIAAVLATAVSARAQDLQRRIEGIIASGKIGDATVGVSIVDLQTGRTLAAVRDAEGFIPASNMKLLTSGTAMNVLGTDFAFRTELLLDGDTLVIRGAGDPALADPAILEHMTPPTTVRQLVATLADAVRKSGVTRVAAVVADDRIFDRQFVHPSWPADQLHKWYCAEVAGINFHTNVLTFFPSAAPEGPDRPPTFSLEPESPWIEVENKARTGPRNANSIWVQRDPKLNAFALFGEIGPGARVATDVSLHDVPLYFAQSVAAELLRAGVSVAAAPSAGTPTRDDIAIAVAAARSAGPADRFDHPRTVAAVSTHVADIYQRINADSQNLYAECLLKRVGRDVTGEPGSWINGPSVVRMTLAQTLGPDAAAETVVSDGSGMSRENRVTPRTMTRWLDALQRDGRFGQAFVSSMAVPGEGTLRNRFRGVKLTNELQAKSGKLDGVRCLSGYVTDPATGRRVAFSVLVNNLREGDQALQALKVHEEVVKAIDAWLAPRKSVPGGG